MNWRTTTRVQGSNSAAAQGELDRQISHYHGVIKTEYSMRQRQT